MVFFGRRHDGVVIAGKAVVVRVADDVDMRIFDGSQIGGRVLGHSAGIVAWLVETGDCIVQLL